MGTSLILILAIGVLLGVWAQKKKGRTGAGWAILSIAVLFLLYFFVFVLLRWDEPGRSSPEIESSALHAGIISAVLGGGLLALIVATLPKRS